MKKVGVMGGTFNPIHKGHLAVAQRAQEQYALDEVIFMPCKTPYMKSGQRIECGSVRAEMTALAIRDIPCFTLSLIEMEQTGNTYTYKTMEFLKKEHPDTDYYFILGADNLFQIEEWVYPERIFACCHILAAVREEKNTPDMEIQADLLKKKYGASIHLIKMERMDISASAIRKKISMGESIAGDVPEAVRNYIEKNRLYL